MARRTCWVAALAPLLLLAAAPDSSHGRAASPCQGVRLLSQPLVISGVGELILETAGPPDNRIQCAIRNGNQAPGGNAPARGSGQCEDAQTSGARLSPPKAAKSVRCLIDERRTKRGLQPLQPRKELANAARRHTEHMLVHGCFSHRCSGEPDLVARVTETNYLPCTCAWTVAENIAWGKRHRSTPAAIVAAWMDSPPHRDTMLRPDLRDLGVGVEAGAPGKPNSEAATYTADFGVKN